MPGQRLASVHDSQVLDTVLRAPDAGGKEVWDYSIPLTTQNLIGMPDRISTPA